MFPSGGIEWAWSFIFKYIFWLRVEPQQRGFTDNKVYFAMLLSSPNT